MLKKSKTEKNTNDNTALLIEFQKENFKLKQEIKTLYSELNLWEENGILLSKEEQRYFFAQHRKLEQLEAEQKKSEKPQLEKLAERLNNALGGNKHDEAV
jgi:hypothetical protein